MISKVILMGLLLLSQASLAAQSVVTQTTEQQARAAKLADSTKDPDSIAKGAQGALEQKIAPFRCDDERSDDAVHKACLSAQKAYYDYHTMAMDRRLSVYAWNSFSTKVIFVAVLIIIGMGLYFSWAQFFGVTIKEARTLLAKSAAAGAEEQQTPVRAVVTELDIGPGGLRLKSPVLGVILLALSIAFFYLYLIYVYPVTEGF